LNDRKVYYSQKIKAILVDFTEVMGRLQTNTNKQGVPRPCRTLYASQVWKESKIFKTQIMFL